jgi:hypothetical protein
MHNSRAAAGEDIMGEHSKLKTVSVKLGLSEHYLVGRMLMLREKLTLAQWQVYDRSAEAICNQILGRLPADDPESAVWDNRRKRS